MRAHHRSGLFQALLLDGNRITSVDDASCLEPLPKLRNLQLQRPTQHDSPPDASSNPCCTHPQYRVVLRRLVPQERLASRRSSHSSHISTRLPRVVLQLTMLDGESLALVDAAGLDASPSDSSLDLPAFSSAPWFSEADLRLDVIGDGPHVHVARAGADGLEAVLADARQLFAHAKSLAESTRTTTNAAAAKTRA